MTFLARPLFRVASWLPLEISSLSTWFYPSDPTFWRRPDPPLPSVAFAESRSKGRGVLAVERQFAEDAKMERENFIGEGKYSFFLLIYET